MAGLILALTGTVLGDAQKYVAGPFETGCCWNVVPKDRDGQEVCFRTEGQILSRSKSWLLQLLVHSLRNVDVFPVVVIFSLT